ncbi:hypothetical protein N7539_002716 [Penicillium diatomitis]|uniref:Uncharacterized protein n=1 Tax=Penicillium diatomitis TaxID=2819901 RepID=A0A9W9XFB5_9EURO|nr:uncharacterized protein N7539_002716 [Penicillium diatomitis]KAJ5491149.1 hypothetical protein N7539_002716 [Penicillium diatomitis]
MPVYHIDPVLFRLKEGVAPAQVDAFHEKAKGMVGKIPGIARERESEEVVGPHMQCNEMILTWYMTGRIDFSRMQQTPSNLSTACTRVRHGTRGGPGKGRHRCDLCCASSPLGLREELCDDTLAYDLEF